MLEDDVRKRLEEYGEIFCKVDEKIRSFDFAFKISKKVFLIKITKNIENITREKGLALKKAADALDVIPTILGKRGKDPLEKNVIYHRYGNPTMTLETFISWIDGKEVIMAERGGKVLPVDFENLPADISVETLAKSMGKSKRMIFKYQKGSKPRLDSVRKIPQELYKKLKISYSYRPENTNNVVFIGKGPFEMAEKEKKKILISFRSNENRQVVLSEIKRNIKSVVIKFLS